MTGYTPAGQDRRAAAGLPPATGADDPPAWHDRPGVITAVEPTWTGNMYTFEGASGADDPPAWHDQPGTQPEVTA